MLFKADILKAIERGDVTLAFRRWTKPTVRAGGTLRTAIGVLAIDAVEQCKPDGISDDDARQAGFASRDLLLTSLAKGRSGTLYRIAFHRSGDDPRVGLRAETRLEPQQIADLKHRLATFDAGAKKAWSLETLRLIAARDGMTAAEIAAATVSEKVTVKTRMLKLKELGLTESLAVGYRLSPRGRAFLAIV